MSNDNVPALPADKPDFAKAIEAALARMEVRKEFVNKAKEKLVKGQDWGDIPGVDKPVLFKSGAEALVQSVTAESESLFMGCGRFGEPTFESVVEVHGSPEWALGYFFYRVRISVLGPSGNVLCWGVGSCNTQEGKYKQKRDGTLRPAHDSANTVLKMAVKRAKVDGAMSFSGGSEMFTQDVEDESDDPLDRKLKFGKHAGMSLREVAQADRGWVEWLSKNGKKPGDIAMAKLALEEAEEMVAAAAESEKAPAEPAKRRGRPPKPADPTSAPAEPVAPTEATPQGAKSDASRMPDRPATAEEIQEIKSALMKRAEDLGIPPKSTERKAYYDEAAKAITAAIGREAVLAANDPKAPSLFEAVKIKRAIEDLFGKLRTAVPNRELSDLCVEIEKTLSEMYPEKNEREREFVKLRDIALPPDGSKRPFTEWSIASVKEVLRCLKARLVAKPKAPSPAEAIGLA